MINVSVIRLIAKRLSALISVRQDWKISLKQSLIKTGNEKAPQLIQLRGFFYVMAER
ncbi:hypothetical protein H098_16245 [Pseudomonas fluorescens FH5]|nr:hypothetical protein H098_16245 [Pseudomonas fluorescens FH5]